jgi:hypothetical protein
VQLASLPPPALHVICEQIPHQGSMDLAVNVMPWLPGTCSAIPRTIQRGEAYNVGGNLRTFLRLHHTSKTQHLDVIFVSPKGGHIKLPCVSILGGTPHDSTKREAWDSG